MPLPGGGSALVVDAGGIAGVVGGAAGGGVVTGSAAPTPGCAVSLVVSPLLHADKANGMASNRLHTRGRVFMAFSWGKRAGRKPFVRGGDFSRQPAGASTFALPA